MEKHLGEHITLSALARAAYVSIRKLDRLFRELLRKPPMTVLRDLRIDRMHDRLISDGQGVSVKALMHECGLHHGGDFARHYFQRYRELPSQTLRAARRSGPVMSWRINAKYETVFVTPALMAFNGRKLEQLCGDGWHEIVHPDDFDGIMAQFREVSVSPARTRLQYRLHTAQNGYAWVTDDVYPYLEADGSLAGFYGIIHVNRRPAAAVKAPWRKFDIVITPKFLGQYPVFFVAKSR